MATVNACASAFRSVGADALSDYELMEMVLFRALPRRDVKPLAKSLITKFGSFAETVHAPDTRLREVGGLGESAITEIKLIAAATSRVAKGQLKQRTVFSSWATVIDYCRMAMAFADKEQFRILFLDKRNQLICRRSAAGRHHRSHPGLSARGGEASTRTVSDAIIMVHNHPSGDPTPSQADVQMTKAVIDVAAPLGIAVHDHIIVGKHGHASLKGLKLI
jgi:DNA repair protein RadC